VIRCKRCNSSQTYVRLSTQERVCKTCGHIEELKKEGQEDVINND